MEKKQQFIIKVFTENQVGLLNRITGILSRRRMNIEHLEVHEAEEQGISQYSIMVCESAEQIKRVVKQIEKQVDVIRAYAEENVKQK